MNRRSSLYAATPLFLCIGLLGLGACGETPEPRGLAPRGAAGVGTLVSVRAARHDGYDRVVWELAGAMAGVHVEYVDEPVRQCGSGEPVPLPGDGWLEIRLEPARAHTEEGRPTMATRSPEPFRLTILGDPPRVVVDVRHGSR